MKKASVNSTVYCQKKNALCTCNEMVGLIRTQFNLDGERMTNVFTDTTTITEDTAAAEVIPPSSQIRAIPTQNVKLYTSSSTA
jgi:hypothetical protein